MTTAIRGRTRQRHEGVPGACGCTAIRTATPTNIGAKRWYAVNNEPRKEARGEPWRTPVYKPRRIPYALPNTHFEPSQARRDAAWDVSIFGVSPPVQQPAFILFFASDMLYSSAIRAVLEIVIFSSLLMGGKMPRRTNQFQQLIHAIHLQLSKDVKVGKCHFVGHLPDGNTITCHGELSRDSANWEQDLDVTYTRKH
jgi:hypothetical protein